LFLFITAEDGIDLIDILRDADIAASGALEILSEIEFSGDDRGIHADDIAAPAVYLPHTADPGCAENRITAIRQLTYRNTACHHFHLNYPTCRMTHQEV